METGITTIRPGDSIKGQAALVISNTASYSWMYDDRGSGAAMNVCIWRPWPMSFGWCVIGDYAQTNYSNPTGTALLIRAVNDDPNNPLLQPPAAYTQVWNDQGSGGDFDGSIWYPVPPTGYISIGYVGQHGYNSPAPSDFPNAPYMCVRKDLVKVTSAGGLIWNDQKSGADSDVSLYLINGVPNSFVAQADYNPFAGTAYQLAGYTASPSG